MGKIVTRPIKRVIEPDSEQELFQQPVAVQKPKELTPQTPFAAPVYPENFRAYLFDGELEEFEERAAIREHDGGLEREHAESGALEDLWNMRHELYDDTTMKMIQELDLVEVGNFERFSNAVA